MVDLRHTVDDTELLLEDPDTYIGPSKRPRLFRVGSALLCIAITCIVVGIVYGLKSNNENSENNSVTWYAGTSSVSLLPTVNNRLDYWNQISDDDCCSPGTVVPNFDVGNISVGNGKGVGRWVRDDIRGTVAVLQKGLNGPILVIISADLYMFFWNDLTEYFTWLREAIGDTRYNNLQFLIHAAHNHAGPDTSGLDGQINHDYYRYMLHQLVSATTKALDNMIPVSLFVGEKSWAFGLNDVRDPILKDQIVRILHIKKQEDSSTLVTLVQWAFHPEVAAFFTPTLNPDDCTQLGESNCDPSGRVFTADFPGNLRRILQKEIGGEVLYITGAVGVQIGPGNGFVWEVNETYPITGDGSVPPPGAQQVPRNYRSSFLIGSQLAYAIRDVLQNNSLIRKIDDSCYFRYKEGNFFTYNSNINFRIASCPESSVGGDPNVPLQLGHQLKPSFNCLDFSNPTEQTCISDNYTWTIDNTLGQPVRVGDFVRTEIRYVEFVREINGSEDVLIKMLTVPGEIAPEMMTGVPRDFDNEESIPKYYTQPTYHAVGSNYTFPGSLNSMLKCNQPCSSSNYSCTSCWFMGLTMDELGYMFPISDWRIKCILDSQTCNSLPLDYFDSMSGTTCNLLTEDPSLANQIYGPAGEAILSICRYGQLQKAQDHYEETNSIGWNVNYDYFSAVSRIVGVPMWGRYDDDRV